jgi:HPt (histidine-containing phosphotransfer) domain-containing protein
MLRLRFLALKKSIMSAPTFDRLHIEAQWGDLADDTYQAILQIFLDEGKTICANLRSSLGANQRDAMLRSAHTIRGAASNVGALHLADCADRLEAAVENADTESLAKLVDDVEVAWRDVLLVIEAGGPAASGD